MKIRKCNNKLLIIGAGGHGRVVADIALKMNRWQQLAFLDDDENIKSSMNIDIVGKLCDAFTHTSDCDIFVAIGNNKTREKIQGQLEALGANIPKLIHPSAVIGEKVEIGSGTVIMAGVVINCCSKIGKSCIINTGSTIDHDNIIEEYVHISPGVHLGGTVSIGKSSWIGIGATISNNVNITSRCIVGAGAVVIKDITEVRTYVGVPATMLNRGDQNEHTSNSTPC
jgi:sugar O-acyltransferase (sialic acid O-acetyltransferase NeuD family)